MTTTLATLRLLPAIALAWSAAWVAQAIAVGAVIGAVRPGDLGPGETPLALAPMIGLAGLACGVAFAVVVGLAERRLAFAAIPAARLAAWGALVGAIFPVAMGQDAAQAIVVAPAGAAGAIASLALVRAWQALSAPVAAR